MLNDLEGAEEACRLRAASMKEDFDPSKPEAAERGSLHCSIQELVRGPSCAAAGLELNGRMRSISIRIAQEAAKVAVHCTQTQDHDQLRSFILINSGVGEQDPYSALSGFGFRLCHAALNLAPGPGHRAAQDRL